MLTIEYEHIITSFFKKMFLVALLYINHFVPKEEPTMFPCDLVAEGAGGGGGGPEPDGGAAAAGSRRKLDDSRLQCSIKDGVLTIPAKSDSTFKIPDDKAKEVVSVTIPKETKLAESAFANCINLKEVIYDKEYVDADIPKNCFAGCSSLETINLRATTIGDTVFTGCSKLSVITVSGTSVALKEKSLEGCSALTTFIDESDGLTIDDNSFAGLDKLVNLQLKSVTDITANKLAGGKYQTIIIGGKCTIESNAKSLFAKFKETLVELRLRSTGITTLIEGLFTDSAIKTLELSAGAVALTDKSFDGLSTVEELTIGGTTTFSNADILKPLTNLQSLHIIGKAVIADNNLFQSATTVTSIVINTDDASKISLDYFDKCAKLTELIIGGKYTLSAGTKAIKLTGLIIKINTSGTIPKETFKDCELKQVSIGSHEIVLSEGAFTNSKISMLDIPSTTTFKASETSEPSAPEGGAGGTDQSGSGQGTGGKEPPASGEETTEQPPEKEEEKNPPGEGTSQPGEGTDKKEEEEKTDASEGADEQGKESTESQSSPQPPAAESTKRRIMAATTLEINGNAFVSSSISGVSFTALSSEDKEVVFPINDAFGSSVTTVNVGSGVTSIKNGVFDSLKKITVSLPETLESVDPALFSKCEEVTPEVNENNKKVKYSGNAFYGVTDGKTTSLLAIVPQATSLNVESGVTEIKANVFYANNKLQNIELPETVTSIEKSAFAQSKDLKELTYHGKTEFKEPLFAEGQTVTVKVSDEYPGKSFGGTEVTVTKPEEPKNNTGLIVGVTIAAVVVVVVAIIVVVVVVIKRKKKVQK